MYLEIRTELVITTVLRLNNRVSEMRARLAARREPTEAENRQPSVLYISEHKA